MRGQAAFVAAVIAVLLTSGGAYASPRLIGIHKIRHIVVIMQENRSFDSYFGTYPGADGIPKHVCVPDPNHGGCQRPYHDHRAVNFGGPHDHIDAVKDVSAGGMNGFIAQAEAGRRTWCNKHINAPACSLAPAKPDVMGYHDWHEIPNYWSYARHFVLQDHVFQADASWSLPGHLYLVSGWSARCAQPGNPMSCVSSVQAPGSPPGEPQNPTGAVLDYAWTDLTYLLYRNHVSWRYYVFKGTQPDCGSSAMFCKALPQNAKTPGIWNPLPWFETVEQDRQRENVAPFDDFMQAARTGTLPSVSWLAPAQAVSDHPPASIRRGQAYVTGVVDAIMRSPDWSSTAIFLTWDDWGGFYDHVKPPLVDAQGYGLRAPGTGIGDQSLREARLHRPPGAELGRLFEVHRRRLPARPRLNPKTDGRPDGRPTVRESVKILGDLRKEFDFSQQPRRPLFLPLRPKFS